ncbi:MAG: hypothetical protein AAGF12_33435 [Myxococcota bacterium]
MNAVLFSAVLPFAVLVGCGSATRTTESPSPPPPDPVTPTSTEVAPPTGQPELAPVGFLAADASIDSSSVLAPAVDDRTQCGRVGRRPLDAEVSLLDGRLHMRPVQGAILEPRPWNIMGAPEPMAAETRIYLEAGDEKVVVMTYELFALAGIDFVEQVRADAARSFPNTRLEQVAAIGAGLEALQVVPQQLDTSRDAVFTYGLYVVSPDRTVQVMAFYVSPSAATEGECTALAMRSARTLRAGDRTLEFQGQTWSLVSGASGPLSLRLPEGYTVYTQEGPDFWVHRIRRVVAFGDTGPGGFIYFGGHPSAIRAGDQFEGRLLGDATTWVRSEDEGHSVEAIRPVGEHWFTHASVRGASADETAPLLQAIGNAALPTGTR